MITELTMDNTTFENIELSNDILDQIAGGVLDEKSRQDAHDALLFFKQQGASKERVLALFALIENPQEREDSLAYINEVWDTL